MPDANVAVNFTASVGDLLSGIAQARDALSSLSAPSQQLNADYDAQRDLIQQNIKDQQAALKLNLANYAQDLRVHQITEQQKVALSRAALDEEYAAHDGPLAAARASSPFLTSTNSKPSSTSVVPLYGDTTMKSPLSRASRLTSSTANTRRSATPSPARSIPSCAGCSPGQSPGAPPSRRFSPTFSSTSSSGARNP